MASGKWFSIIGDPIRGLLRSRLGLFGPICRPQTPCEADRGQGPKPDLGHTWGYVAQVTFPGALFRGSALPLWWCPLLGMGQTDPWTPASAPGHLRDPHVGPSWAWVPGGHGQMGRREMTKVHRFCWFSHRSPKKGKIVENKSNFGRFWALGPLPGGVSGQKIGAHSSHCAQRAGNCIFGPGCIFTQPVRGDNVDLRLLRAQWTAWEGSGTHWGRRPVILCPKTAVF